jgi:hypothetical protein
VLAPLEPDQTVEAVVGLVPDLDRSAALALHEAAASCAVVMKLVPNTVMVSQM